MFQIIYFIYTSLNWGNVVSAMFYVNNVVHQDGILSPILYTLQVPNGIVSTICVLWCFYMWRPSKVSDVQFCVLLGRWHSIIEALSRKSCSWFSPRLRKHWQDSYILTVLSEWLIGFILYVFFVLLLWTFLWVWNKVWIKQVLNTLLCSGEQLLVEVQRWFYACSGSLHTTTLFYPKDCTKMWTGDESCQTPPALFIIVLDPSHWKKSNTLPPRSANKLTNKEVEI